MGKVNISIKTKKESDRRMSGGIFELTEIKDHIIIAGGGLVGGVAAAMLADKGHQVDLYELREDPR